MLANEIRQSILQLSAAGQSYSEIAKELSLSRNTVKSICQRNKNTSEVFCKYCGKSMKQRKGRKQKNFCSDKCRANWWYETQKKTQSIELICENCGDKFISYGNPNKHYCSRKCYCEHVKQEKNHE